MRLPQLILIGAFVLLSEVAEATVTMTSPADGSSVTGVVAVNCTDSDPGATFGFYVDNSFQTTSSGGLVMGYVYSKPRFHTMFCATLIMEVPIVAVRRLA